MTLNAMITFNHAFEPKSPPLAMFKFSFTITALCELSTILVRSVIIAQQTDDVLSVFCSECGALLRNWLVLARRLSCDTPQDALMLHG